MAIGWLAIAWIACTAASPTPDDLRVAWERDIRAIRRAGVHLGEFSAEDFAALAGGSPITKRIDTADGAFGTAAIVMPAPIASAWLTVQEGAYAGEQDSPLTIRPLPGRTRFARDVYFHLQLPWPLSNRQWVARMTSNQKLYAATSGRVWQRSWDVTDPSLAPDPDPKGLWVETTSGSWTLVDVGDHTLAVISAQTVLGGAIPRWISNRWAMRRLARSIRDMAVRAANIEAYYGKNYGTYYVPDGSTLVLTTP